MSDASVIEFLETLPPHLRNLALPLRDVVRRAIPRATESFLWGGLSYHRPDIGGRVKGAVCQIGFKGDQVRLDFIHGIRLSDPHGLLQGKLKSKRFVPIRTLSEVRRPALAALIRQAAALDPADWPQSD